MHFTTPIHEANPCREPKGTRVGGRFAPKGTGNCGPGMTPGQLAKARQHLERNDPPAAILTALGPTFQREFEALRAKVPAAQMEMELGFQRMVRQGVAQTAYTQVWEGRGPRAAVGQPKGIARTLEKTVLENDGRISDLKDAVRATIAVDTPGEIPRMLATVRQHFTVVREKDRITQPLSGYRDYLVNVRLKNGLIGEIQLHVKPLLKAKETTGHHIYQEMRRLATQTGEAAVVALQRLRADSVALYAGAWSLAMAAAVYTGRQA